VTDYLEDSPGKFVADESFMVSTTDVEGVVKLIKEQKVDGLLTGFIDSMLPYYEQICCEADLYCYASKKQIETVTDKTKFKKLCKKFGVPVIEEYVLPNNFTNKDLDEIEFPILLKPVDNSGGRGISICHNKRDFSEAFVRALSFSESGEVIIERYVEGEEVTIFYIMQDGEIYLSAIADRYTNNSQKGVIPLPVGYIFPSKYLKDYQNDLNEKVINMLKSIGVRDGMIFIQSFVENGKFKFYDPGFRLTGSLEYYILNEICGFNPVKMLVKFALSGKMADKNIRNLVNPNFKEYGCNITFLVKPGTINKIIGLEKILAFSGVISAVANYQEGDTIPEQAIGTLGQIVLRVLATAKSKKGLAQIVEKVEDEIRVLDEAGNNMLLPLFETERFLK
jgi:biotin carboxylase